MLDLKGKKLLILGANPETTPLVKVANKMGIKTLVTSNRHTDPAKAYAWKSYDIDGFDVDGLVSLANSEKVDGVLVGVADMLVPAYCQICNRLNLPCYATHEIVNVFSFKDKFKSVCKQYGIHGIPEFKVSNVPTDDELAKIKYPVMVKPVDGYSGVGITLCNSHSELLRAINKALIVSKKKKFIVEKYMQCDDMGIYYTFKDGVCSASCVYDRYTTNEQPGVSRVCLGGTYPSKHIDIYFSNMHANAVKMFKDIGIENGVLMLSAFFENGEFYVYDTGFRLQGEAPHLLLQAIHGYDQREMLIRFALTGSEGEFDIKDYDDAKFSGKWAATLWFLLKEGKIAKITGLEAIDKDIRIVANVQRLSDGDTVYADWIGTEKQVMSRLYLVCDSKEELAQALIEYMGKVHVVDEDGNAMLLKGFSVSQALEL